MSAVDYREAPDFSSLHFRHNAVKRRFHNLPNAPNVIRHWHPANVARVLRRLRSGVRHQKNPIIIAAQDESRPELQDLWARLLAAALDTTRSGRVRGEFIDAVKQFDPLDALVLHEFHSGQSWTATQRDILAVKFHRNPDEIEISLNHLEELGCLGQPGNFIFHPVPFGRELLRSLYV
jgi:hypothetical protein